MPKTITLVNVGFHVDQGQMKDDKGEVVNVSALRFDDPADGTSYVIPLSDDARKKLVAMLTSGIVLAEAL